MLLAPSVLNSMAVPHSRAGTSHGHTFVPAARPSLSRRPSWVPLAQSGGGRASRVPGSTLSDHPPHRMSPTGDKLHVP